MTIHVCIAHQCIWSLIVGGETLVEMWEGCIKVLGDGLHSLMRKLKLHGQAPNDYLYAGEVVCKSVDCCVYLCVGIMIDVGNKLCNFAINFLPLLHQFGEVYFNEGQCWHCPWLQFVGLLPL